MLRARLFGGLAVWVDDRPVPEIGGVKPRSLFAYLLVNAGAHPRARLAGRFWPDVLDTSARGSLRSALWAIRSALEAAGGGSLLVADRLGAGLDPDCGLDVDAREFERLLTSGDDTSLQRAVLIGAEPLLPDIPDEWVLDAQDRHRDRMIDALASLAAAAEAAGDLPRALSYTREALARDRLRESSHRALMRRLAAAGDRGGALAAFRRCRDTLAAELGVPPSAETRALAEEVRAGAAPAGPPPPPRGTDPSPRRSPGPGGMVGRDGELGRCLAAWEGAVAGRGGVILVEGAAGVGKSRLAAELRALADAAGARTSAAHALDIDERPPFGPWADALRPLVRACEAPPATVAWPEDLARLCPAVEAAWDRRPAPAPPEPALGRARLFEAVGEALWWCARQAPVLVVLEDLHRADPSTLALLAHLGPSLQDAPVLVAVTVRAGAEAQGIERTREALARRGGLREAVALGPLDAGDVALLARREEPGLDAAAVAQVTAVAGGNPLLALHAARAAAAGGDPEEGLRDAVRGSMAGLSGPARDLVAVAAAAGRALSIPEGVSLMGADALDDALAEGVACGLLDPGPGADVAFTHDLVRRACYGALPAGRRRAAHARLARMMSGHPSRPPAEVAHHLRGAGDDERARAWLVAAAASARALGALDQAAGHLAEAAASAAAAGAPAAEAEAWLARAEIEAWRGDAPAMDASFAHVRALLTEAGDVRGLAAALAERARWLRTTTCYPEEAFRSSREALELLDASGVDAPETRLLAMAGMAWGEAVAGDPARAEEMLAEVRERLGDEDDVLRAELVMAGGFALVRSGQAARARHSCREAAEIADRAGRPALALDARIGEAACAAAQGLIPEVLEILARAPDPSRTGPALACQSWAGIAHALSRLGRHEAAVEAAREEMRVAERFGNADLEAAAWADLGVTLLAAGRPGEARSALEGCLALEEARVPRAALRLSAAEAALGDAGPAAARAHLERFPFEPVGAGDDPAGLVARLDRVTGLVLLAAGEREAGMAHLDAAVGRWERLLEAARPASEAGEELLSVMIDLGRPPVAGLSDPAGELEKVRDERARAAGGALAGGAG